LAGRHALAVAEVTDQVALVEEARLDGVRPDAAPQAFADGPQPQLVLVRVRRQPVRLRELPAQVKARQARNGRQLVERDGARQIVFEMIANARESGARAARFGRRPAVLRLFEQPSEEGRQPGLLLEWRRLACGRLVEACERSEERRVGKAGRSGSGADALTRTTRRR